MSQPTADDKQRFDTLYSALCEIQTTLLDSTSKVAGFLLLALGWLATSDTARAFLAKDDLTRWVTIAAIFGVFLLTWFISTRAYRASQNLYSDLVELNFLAPKYFHARRITGDVLAVYVAGNACLATVLAVVVARLAH